MACVSRELTAQDNAFRVLTLTLVITHVVKYLRPMALVISLSNHILRTHFTQRCPLLVRFPYGRNDRYKVLF